MKMTYVFAEFSGFEMLQSCDYNQSGIEPLYQSGIQPSGNERNQQTE
jgi:hypothetical protein